MKYGELTLGQIEAIVNKLDGMEGVLQFLRGNVEITMVKHTIDLGASPRLPFDGAEVVKHEGEGVVEIELRPDDNLYVGGKEANLFLSERQKGDKKIVGLELRKELANGEQVLFNNNVLDYFYYDHPELFPEHWKQDENGNTRYIFFWGSIFRRPADGYLCACYLCWNDGMLFRHYSWLDIDWDRQRPSAFLSQVKYFGLGHSDLALRHLVLLFF